MTPVHAPGFPEQAVRARARAGVAAVFPAEHLYGSTMFGATPPDRPGLDVLDRMRLVPPVFMPQRLEKLIDLAREPMHGDVDLDTRIGGFRSALPVYVSAFGSTQVAQADLGIAVSRQAGRLGIPLVIGENVVPIDGYGRDDTVRKSLVGRIRAYTEAVADGVGGVTVQQSTEDADAEVWNQLYSDPATQPLLSTGRLALELKVGQGAKPGLGGMTLLDADRAARVADRYAVEDLSGRGNRLRCSSPGTFTEEILRHQIRLMRNNYPQARVWLKLPPARDVQAAAITAWAAGADAVTVDGAEGGTGWAPTSFLDHVGLPLAECLYRIGPQPSCLLVSGRMWEGTRAAKSLSLGARAVGLGRAALLAADEDPAAGLIRLVDCLALELRLIISALGKYATAALDAEDVWWPSPGVHPGGDRPDPNPDPGG
ncbi:glutamate synthase-related protein [Amycolatopsis sp. NPDC049688]|uniref:glutamate synthase-related protein n=1 Tax=Amycolatopsis sp. NPDC049688 TaxID=3154733 RepID=UPI00344A1C4E